MTSKHPRHKPKKHFKDVVKNIFRPLSVDIGNWKKMVENRSI